MRKGLLVFIIIIFFCALFVSCNLEPIDSSRSINHYIFPYVKFERLQDEDGNYYYTASILEGAKVASVYIPSYVEDSKSETGSFPVKVFTGFESDDDIVNLTSIAFASSITEIKLKSLDQARVLETIGYEDVESDAVWTNLPEFLHTSTTEFVGWFTTDTKEQVKNGDKMDPEHSKIFAKYLYVELIEHKKSDATCTEDGYTQDCWECNTCGRFFSDDQAENEIEEDIVIPATGHKVNGTYEYDIDNHWQICTVEGIKVYVTEHSWGDWQTRVSGNVEHLYKECSVCGARKVATKPEYLVYDIGIGEIKLKALEATPCGDFYINNTKVESGATITVDSSTVTAEFRPYFGCNTNYANTSTYVLNGGRMQEKTGETDSSGNYVVTFTLNNKSEHILNIQIGTEGGNLAFECSLYKKTN